MKRRENSAPAPRATVAVAANQRNHALVFSMFPIFPVTAAAAAIPTNPSMPHLRTHLCRAASEAVTAKIGNIENTKTRFRSCATTATGGDVAESSNRSMDLKR